MRAEVLKMNKKLIIIGVVLLGVIIAVAAFFYMTVIGPQTATLAHVDDLHMKLSASSLDELEAIIRNNADPYTRERAVNVYTDIALRSQNSKRALAFLKGLAPDEKDDNVRTSAYTNYYYIKEEAGIPPETTMDVQVIGDIKPGKNITVVLSVMSTRGSDLSFVGMQARTLQETAPATGTASAEGMTNIINANTGKGAQTNVVLTPSYRIRQPLPANMTVEYPYTVSIKGPGKVVLESIVEVRYDMLDYDTVKKDIYLDVGSTSGTYAISG
jgi:hypothetical protein